MDISKVNQNMKIQEDNHLSISRAVIRPGDANLLPRVFVENSILPEWANTIALFYAMPAIGARFLECQLLISQDGGARERIQNGYENFMYIIDGSVEAVISGKAHTMEKEGYFWLPPQVDFEIKNTKAQTAKVLWVRKQYIETKFFPIPAPIISSVLDVPAVQNLAEIEQQCMPFEKNIGFDMAMNMLTFRPGVTFPRVETHVFEHGGYFLNGRGDFFINGVHYEVHEDDFCYMAPYTPHYVAAYGPAPLRYLLYKNVNRDYEL